MGASAKSRWRLEALHNRSFASIWTAGVISQVGDWALWVGLVFYVYLLTGSTLATGTALLAAVVPQALVGLFAGVYVDRWSRKRTMIVTNLVLAAGLLPLLEVHSASGIWIVYVVLAFESAIEAFFPPAEGALIPDVVGEALLLQANSIYGSGRQMARLIGAALGGALVALYGLKSVTAVDLASFVLAAAILLPLIEPDRRKSVRPPSSEVGWSNRWGRFKAEWLEGFSAARQSNVAWTILVFCTIAYFGEGVFGTLVAPFVEKVLHGSGIDYGLFLSLQAIGGIAGGLAVAGLGKRTDPRRLMPAAAVVFGLADLALFNYPLFIPGILLAFVLIVLVGLPAAAYVSALTALQQSGTAPSARGRYLAATQTAGLVTMISGALLAGILGNRVGIIPLLEIQGSVYVLGGVFASLRFRKSTPLKSRFALNPTRPSSGADE
jgi:predicted MFS family arabinose efflux permease